MTYVLIKRTLRWGDEESIRVQEISTIFFLECIKILKELATSDKIVSEFEFDDCDTAHLFFYDKTTTVEDGCPKWATTYEIRRKKDDAIHSGTKPYDDLKQAIESYCTNS